MAPKPQPFGKHEDDDEETDLLRGRWPRNRPQPGRDVEDDLLPFGLKADTRTLCVAVVCVCVVGLVLIKVTMFPSADEYARPVETSPAPLWTTADPLLVESLPPSLRGPAAGLGVEPAKANPTLNPLAGTGVVEDTDGQGAVPTGNQNDPDGDRGALDGPGEEPSTAAANLQSPDSDQSPRDGGGQQTAGQGAFQGGDGDASDGDGNELSTTLDGDVPGNDGGELSTTDMLEGDGNELSTTDASQAYGDELSTTALDEPTVQGAGQGADGEASDADSDGDGPMTSADSEEPSGQVAEELTSTLPESVLQWHGKEEAVHHWNSLSRGYTEAIHN
ncbi:unnamed protein product [Symbiodinium pilosum]|uniref:Uncharacterized protein n=1 Tax=Symbiodinium pilosum TaxID=2952 RepID=A0A812JV16_SYMPI|nr:unnamed protein product [Symbiodinium pilosum]